tara:strand:- start:282 stop:1010 length:729 start_codon:yes stop_codon:yes gene_type:complete
MAYGFFAGRFDNTIDNVAHKNAGYRAFCYFSAAEGAQEYAKMSQIFLKIDTPNNTEVPNSSVANNDMNDAKVGGPLVDMGDSDLKADITNGPFGGLNGGGTIDTENPFYYIGILDFDTFNAAASPPTFADSGGADTYDGNKAFTTAGNVINADSTTFTVCVPSGPKFGQSTADATGVRATYRFAADGLALGLSKLNYYKPDSSAYGLYVTSGMSDEQAAGIWLSSGYGILKGGGALAFSSLT